MVGRQYPRAYFHQHEEKLLIFNLRPKWALQIITKSTEIDEDSEAERILNTKYKCKSHLDKIDVTTGNHFSGDKIVACHRENGFGLTCTISFDHLPKGVN